MQAYKSAGSQPSNQFCKVGYNRLIDKRFGSEGSINSNEVLLHGLIFMHFLACDEQFNSSFNLNSSSNFSIMPKNFYFRSPCQLLGL